MGPDAGSVHSIPRAQPKSLPHVRRLAHAEAARSPALASSAQESTNCRKFLQAAQASTRLRTERHLRTRSACRARGTCSADRRDERSEQPGAAAKPWRSGPSLNFASPEASRLAQRALEVGRDDAGVLCGSGWTLALVVRDLGVGTRLVDRALMLNSNLAEAWRCSGWMKIWSGDPKLAIEHYARATRLSPLGRWLVDIQSGIAHAHFFLGRYDEAASWAATALQDNPGFQAGIRISAARSPSARTPAKPNQSSPSSP
jgi:tetratricopeptide (TPR) repeat protein